MLRDSIIPFIVRVALTCDSSTGPSMDAPVAEWSFDRALDIEKELFGG